jgi:hypothetical protein
MAIKSIGLQDDRIKRVNLQEFDSPKIFEAFLNLGGLRWFISDLGEMFDGSSPQVQQFHQQPRMHLACPACRGPQHGELGGLFKTLLS